MRDHDTKRLLQLLMLTLVLSLSAACARKDVNRKGQIKLRGEKPVSTQAKREGELLQRGTASWYGYPYHGRKTSSGETYDMELKTAAHKTLPFGTVLKVVDQESGNYVFVRVNDRGPFVRGRIIDLSKGAARDLDLIRKGTTEVNIYLASARDLGTEPAPKQPEPTPKPVSEARVEPPKPRVEKPKSQPVARTRPRRKDPEPETIVNGVVYAPDEVIEEEILEPGAELPTQPIAKPRPKANTSGNYWTVQVGSFSSRDRAEVVVLQMQAYDDHVFLVEGDGTWRVRVGKFARRGDAEQLAARLSEDEISTWITRTP